MSTKILYLFFGLLVLLLGGFIGNLLARLKYKTESERLNAQLEFTTQREEILTKNIETISDERNTLRKDKEELNIQLTRLTSEYEALAVALEKEKQRFATFEKDFNDKFENRSEEHTSELQSRPHLVCRLLLEKK